ncbi:MAG: MFS transporter [Solirubrobacteraceae bacterium]|nr:MFS transporter [Solirubrobacteraceae bacterium]
MDTVSQTPGDGLTPLARALFVATCCVSIAVIMGLTAGAIAVVPDIGRDIGGTQSDLQWATDAFPLIVAALLLPAGAVLDRYGRRRGMLIGLVVLTTAVAWTAASDSIGQVIASRAVAGVGAALLFPGTLASITAALPAERRPFGVAAWAISVIIGAVVGLLIFACGVEWAGWREPFALIAAISAALVLLTARYVPETKAEHEVSLDPVGAVTSVVAIGGLTLAVTEGPVHGWLGTTTLVAATVGAVMLVAFVRWELRHPRPLLDVRLFVDGRFGAASTSLFVMFFAHFALFYLSIQYQGYVLGYSTLKSSLGVVPPVMGYALTPLGPWLARRIGRRAVIVGSMCLCVVGAGVAAGMAIAGTESYWTFAVGAGLMWSGIGLAMAPPTEMIIESVPAEKQGVASAVNDLARELSAAVGIAVAGSAFNTAYRASVDDHVDGLGAFGATVLASPGAAIEALAGRDDGPRVLRIIEDGVMSGWIWAFVITGAVVAAGAVVVWWRCPDRATERRLRTAIDEPVPAPPDGAVVAGTAVR